jgi:predicted ATPase
MFISAVYIRFFRSFNYDYLRKAHPEFEPDPWDVVADELKYPFVEVPLERGVTTVVGANESGKSQLLSAIKCALTGKDIRLGDFCRYSQFFAVDETMTTPDFGLKLSGLTAAEKTAFGKALKGRPTGLGDQFCVFRIRGQDQVVYVLDGERWQQVPLKPDHGLDALLPRWFEIQSNVALPDSVPIRYLVDGEHSFYTARRPERLQFMRTVVSKANEWFGGPVRPGKEAHPAADAYNKVRSVTVEYEQQLKLADKLLFKIAGINQKAFAQLWDAVASDNDGYANSIVAAMNQQLAAKLNFPKWWSQDHHFQLLLTLRDQDLVFTVRDRTGTEYSAGERSTGLRYFLSYFIQYLSHDKPEAGINEILLMDEPDAYLSSAGQQDLLRIFEDFAEPEDLNRAPCQVVYVTHSPFLIDKNHGERIRVLEKGEGDEGTRVVRNAAQNHYEPLRSAFGAFVAETTFISNCNLMVEGAADQVLLAGMAARLRRADPDSPDNIDLNTVTLVPASGAKNIPYMVYLARGRDVDKPAVVVLLDSDKEGDEAAAELRKGPKGKPLLKPEFVIQLGNLDDDAVTTANPEGVAAIEDLVPLDVALAAIKMYADSFLAPDQAAAVATLALDDIVYDGRKGTADAVECAVAAKVSGFSLSKVGLARCVMDVVSSDTDLPGIAVLDTNFRSVFTGLGKMQRKAMRELTAEQTGSKIKRLKKSFLMDHPNTATKAQVMMLMEDIDASLDSSLDAEVVRNQIVSTKRVLRLDGKASDPIADYNILKAELDKLTYTLVNDAQVPR